MKYGEGVLCKTETQYENLPALVKRLGLACNLKTQDFAIYPFIGWYGTHPKVSAWTIDERETRDIGEQAFIRGLYEMTGDDVIRVGDTVERITPTDLVGDHYVVGWQGVVTKIDADSSGWSIVHFGKVHGDLNKYKKIKAGGPSPTTNNQSSNEQVHRSIEGTGNGPSTGKAIRSDSCTGRIATASRLVGNRITAATGKGRVGHSEISHTSVLSNHL